MIKKFEDTRSLEVKFGRGEKAIASMSTDVYSRCIKCTTADVCKYSVYGDKYL